MRPDESPERTRSRSLFLAAVAATPGAVITVLALNPGGLHMSKDFFVGALSTTVVCFIASLISVAIFGRPISALLQKRKWTSASSYIAAGACVPLALFAVSRLYAWHFIESGPFSASLRDQVGIEGATRVIARNVALGFCLAASGAIAAYVFWMTLRPDKSLDRTREGEGGNVR